MLDRIEAEIATGTFDYRRFFPESNLASQFDVPARATSAIDKATSPTSLFRDFSKEWYAQHEIEWKRYTPMATEATARSIATLALRIERVRR